MSHPLLEIDSLTAGYDGAAVLRDLNLRIAPGEVVAMLGPNGAGKTTCLQVIAGLLKPMRGSVRFDRRDIAGLSPQSLARSGLCYVPDDRGIFFELTVGEHFQLDSRRQHPILDDVLTYFPELASLRRRRVGLLSGGEQQMLAVARALARRPRVLLLDELSLGLAPVIVERLLPVVRRYATDNQAGVLLVEQHVHLALEIADRGIALSHGEVVLKGDAATLRRDPSLLEAGYFHAARLS